MISRIESIISGSLVYQGTWDASSNTPTLVDGVGATGFFYKVIVEGTQDLGSGSIDFVVGDRVVYNGNVWQKTQASSSANWGEIVGDIVNQTDLQTALGLKTDDTVFDAHLADVANPHVVTTTQLGLENVDNVSDADKPISDDTQVALDLKVNLDKDNVLIQNPFRIIDSDAFTTTQFDIVGKRNSAGQDVAEILFSNIPPNTG